MTPTNGCIYKQAKPQFPKQVAYYFPNDQGIPKFLKNCRAIVPGTSVGQAREK